MKFKTNFTKFFKGWGTIIMNDIALVMVGEKDKFYIPIFGLFASFWKKVLTVDTIRTVPYSAIKQYRSLSNNSHEIIYWTPTKKEIRVVFFINGNEATITQESTGTKHIDLRTATNEVNKTFSEQLQERIALTKTFLEA